MNHMQQYFLKAKNGALRVVQYLEIPEKKRTFEQSLQAINAYWIPGGAIHPMKTLPFIPKNHRNMKLYWAALKQTPDAWEAVPNEWKKNLVVVQVAEGNCGIANTENRQMFLNALKSILQNEERFPTPTERDKRLNAVSPGLAARYNKLSDMFPDVPPEELVAQALYGVAEILDIKLPVFE